MARLPTAEDHALSPAPQRRPLLSGRLGTLFAGLAIAGVLYFLTAVSVAEVLRPMYDPVRRTISELALGAHGSLLVSAFIALGLSLLALPAGMWSRVRTSLSSRVGLVLMLVCGVSSFVAAVFPTDLRSAAVATLTGEVHGLSAGVGYVCMVIAMVLLSWDFRRDRQWRSFGLQSAVLTLIGVAALLAFGVAGDRSDIAGLLQRVMAGTVLFWAVLTALHACRMTSAGRQRRDPSPGEARARQASRR
jgi:hypothetical membrane protein